MAETPRPLFPHHRNPDGTIDSICGRCFVTVASASKETELEAAEDAHVCPGLDLGQVFHPENRRH